MSQLSDFFAKNNGSSGLFQLKAGGSIQQNDLSQLGPDGRAYTVSCTDYAAVANCNYGTVQTNVATGQILAQTQLVGTQTVPAGRQALLQGADSSIYTFTGSTSGNGLALTKYTSAGALSAQVVVDSTTTVYSCHQMAFLSNGNILVAANGTGSAFTVSYAIYDTNLNLIKSITALGEQAASAYFAVTVLSGGGFAFVYHQYVNSLLTRFATYDNTGALVVSPMTVWTRTGTSGVQYHRIAQLSNGNLAIVISSNNTTSSIGFFHGIVTIAGVTVLAFTNLTTYSIPMWAELVVLGNYYAVGYSSSASTVAVSVFDNTGALQGAPFSATAAAVAGSKYKLLTGNGYFWFIASFGSASTGGIVRIPTTGTNYKIFNLNASLFSVFIDAFYENGLIVIVSQPVSVGNYQPALWVFSESLGALVSQAATLFGVQPGTNNGQYQRVIPGGDFSFICMYDYSSNPTTNLCIGKYASTAVMGVAQSLATTDSMVIISGANGAYSTNYVKGSPSKQFDQSAANIYGNKGVMMNYGAVLKGL